MNGGRATTPVAIVGGGFSGAALAWHLLRLRPDIPHVVIVEPRAELGRGLAYSAADPSHRINVPAARMSLIPEDREHFNRWLLRSGRLDADPAARRADGSNFPARSVFGAYVAEHLAALGDRVQHLAARATAIRHTARGYSIACSDGSTVLAGQVAIAVCHPPPAPPAPLDTLSGHPRLFANPWRADALDTIAADERVLIVGTGLTMADIVAGLDARGHRGTITAVSRRGLRSRGHPPVPAAEPYGDFATRPAFTVPALVKRVRATIREAGALGIGWHAVMDQVRLQGPAIWAALPLPERRRLVRRLRPFWDVHRFRIAPQIEAVLDRRLAEGSLVLRRAALAGATAAEHGIDVNLRGTGGITDTTRFDAVVLATGPAHGGLLRDDPLLSQLHAAGLVRPDAVGLGIEVDDHGRAVGTDGRPQDGFFIAGPLARGTFGELMGLPEVTRHAVRIAGAIAASLPAQAPAAVV